MMVKGQSVHSKKMSLDFMIEAYEDWKKRTGGIHEIAEKIINNPKKYTEEKMKEMEAWFDGN